MKSRTEQILMVMHILAWITFIGLMIKAGAILVSYGVSVVNPEGSKNLYKGLDLRNLREYDFWNYTAVVSLKVALVLIEVYIAYLVIKILSRIKIENPFRMEFAKTLEKISYYILGAWVVAMIYNAQIQWLSKHVDGLEQDIVSGEFIFLAGIVFVIAQIFKRGVEIQAENELTV